MIEVLRGGVLTTVQDEGRTGHRHEGVPSGGAMDPLALRVANLLVGNPAGAAGVEATLKGPTLRFARPALVALGGAGVRAEAGGRPLPAWRALRVEAGEEVAIAAGPPGCRAYLAVAGGVEVPPVLGSRSTYLRAALGGLEGRALREGDRLPVGDPAALSRRMLAALEGGAPGWGAGPSLLPAYAVEPVVRFVRGSHFDALTPESREAFARAAFRVTPQSDRMGYRVAGPTLALAAPLELISEGVVPGTVQLPPGGDPIVLMADCQTTGGYPRAAQVCAVDLPLVAQLRPGDSLRFREVSLSEARSLYLARERDLRVLESALSLRFR